MSGTTAIIRKELTVYFATPIFYITGFCFLLLGGYFFYANTLYYSLLSFQGAQNPQLAAMLNPQQMIFRPLFGTLAIVVLLLVPLLTMRLLAEEKGAGTAELLFTYPLTDWAVILGKEVLAKLFARRLVQAVEMDVKAPLEPGAYARLSGVPARVELIRASLDLIRLSGLPHRFRTTYVSGLLDAEAMGRLRSSLPRESPFAVQAFDPRRVLDPALRERPVPLPQELRAMEPAGAGLVAAAVAC